MFHYICVNKKEKKMEEKIVVGEKGKISPWYDKSLWVTMRPGRKQGNTARIVDWTIQKLFDGYSVTIHGHCGSNEASNTLALRIRGRLIHEYNIMNSSKYKLVADQRNSLPVFTLVKLDNHGK